jgi:hypothetical protein
MSMPKELLRNHLLAATMNRRWETLTEITRALRKETGASYLRADVARWILELSTDGVHRLRHRQRAGAGGNCKEYRLYVNSEAIMPAEFSSLSRFERERRTAPVNFTWPKPEMK